MFSTVAQQLFNVILLQYVNLYTITICEHRADLCSAGISYVVLHLSRCTIIQGAAVGGNDSSSLYLHSSYLPSCATTIRKPL